MEKKTKKDIENGIISKGQILLATFLIAFLILSQVGQRFFSNLSQGVGAASLLVNNFSETSEQIIDKFSTLQLQSSQNLSAVSANLIATSIAEAASSSAKKTYELGLQQKGKQKLATLKKLYPTYFGWLSDTDTIYLNVVSIRFNKNGYLKGEILPINIIGYVLYMYNGYSPNYQNSEYINTNHIPVDFQFKGKAGDIKYFDLYMSKPLPPAFAQYLQTQFIPM